MMDHITESKDIYPDSIHCNLASKGHQNKAQTRDYLMHQFLALIVLISFLFGSGCQSFHLIHLHGKGCAWYFLIITTL